MTQIIEHTIQPQDVRKCWGRFKRRALYNAFQTLERANRNKRSSRRKVGIIAGTEGAKHFMGDVLRDALPARMIIITEEEFGVLSREGELTLERPAALVADLAFDEVLGEIRSVFDGPPTAEKWTHCLTMVDRCIPEDLERLVAYIQDHLRRWDELELPAWEAPKNHALTGFMPERWNENLPEDELRVAPPTWLLEMGLGQYSVKHELVRVLNLELMKINWGVGKKILANPHLTNITHFNIGENPLTTSKTFYKQLRKHPMAPSIRHLTLYALTMEYEGSIENLNHQDHKLTSLETLRFCYNTEGLHLHILEQMKQYPCFQGVEVETKLVEDGIFEYIS